MADPILLLPPSEAKREGGASAFDPASGQFARLAGERRLVAAALAKAMEDPGAVAKVTGVLGARAEAAAAANQALLGGPALSAGARYAGVVWTHLDPGTLRLAARRRASSILVVSALGGLFAFDDPVPDYKLKMGARLAPLGALAAFWRSPATAALAAVAAGRTIWDLLPAEHAKALDLAAVGAARTIRVEFRAASGAGAAGHAAKAAKGRFTRHLLQAARPGLGAAATFAWEGWQAEVLADDLVAVRRPAGPPAGGGS